MSSPNLANVLSWGLLQFPVLFVDFSTIMTSLDSGNIVCLENITDKSLGLYLDKVFKFLPLKFTSGRGWSKDPENPIHSLSGYILNELLTLKAIVQPSDLTPSQILSSKTAPGVIKDIMKAYPDLSQEIPAILEDMIGGAEVELGGIENAEIARLLGTFFDALGFKVGDGSDNSDDEEAESSSRRLRPEDERGRASLRYMLNVFKSSEKFGSLKNVYAKDPMTQSRSSSSSSSGSSSRANRGAYTATNTKAGSSDDSSSDHDHADGDADADADADTDADGDGDGEVSAPRVGPSMPTAAQFAAAQKAGENYQALNVDDGDDDMGPVPRSLSLPSPAFSNAVPLGLTGASAEELMHVLGSESSLVSRAGSEKEREKNSNKRDADQREEWMLNPGEDRAIAGFETFGVSRKFQTGKKAKKVAAATTEQREAYEESMKHSEESQRTQAILEEFKEKRGASLMDRHVAKKAEQPKAVSTGRRAFDRELDVLSHKGMGKNQVEALVQHAKELDTRFDKGSVQRSFL